MPLINLLKLIVSSCKQKRNVLKLYFLTLTNAKANLAAKSRCHNARLVKATVAKVKYATVTLA